ncbi:MAG: DNA primase [Betaproteobacteria bacterium]|nr:DNA primase [Betaproteobacteria bacterium]
MTRPKEKAARASAPGAASKTTFDGKILARNPAIDTLLSRLDGVKQTGSGTWRAKCPSHGSKGRTLSIREVNDGRVLLHCFAECSPHEVLSAIGLTMTDLFPERLSDHHYPPERRPFPAADVLRGVAFEGLIVATAGAALLAGTPFSSSDRGRLIIAVARIQNALNLAGVSYEH